MTRRLARGELDARMPGTGPAEVSTLAESLNTMAGSLAASRDALRRVAEEQAALRRVATLVARGDPPSRVFGAVAGETGRMLGAECTAVARYEPDGTATVAGSWARPGEAVPAPPPLDSRWAAADEEKNGAPGAGELAAWGREQGIHSSVASPIMVAGRLWGVIIAFSAATEPHAAATVKNRMPLRALERRSGLPVELNTRVDGRLPERVEVAIYYVVSEALTNAAKHMRADQVRIVLGVAGDMLQLAVSDNGPGGADPDRGSGLIGLIDRVEAIGGRIQITSPAGAGTALQVTIPLAALPGRLPVTNGRPVFI